ncbi:hypothetical protein ACT6QE_10410 [Staphylococcus aureus]
MKRRTKNAKAFHDKCENPGNWDTRLGLQYRWPITEPVKAT